MQSCAVAITTHERQLGENLLESVGTVQGTGTVPQERSSSFQSAGCPAVVTPS